MTDPLDPVRDEILRTARQDAAATVESAETAAAELVARANDEAASLLAAARAAGAADAAEADAAGHAHARRAAREILLAARHAAYDETRERALRALRAESTDPRFRAALEDRARAVLGPAVRIEPLPDGGLVGIVGDRTADCSLAGLVDHVLAATAARVSEVWS